MDMTKYTAEEGCIREPVVMRESYLGMVPTKQTCPLHNIGNVSHLRRPLKKPLGNKRH